MPKFFISYSMGYTGTESTDVIEAENQEQAEQEAWQMAIEKIDSYAEPYDEEKHEGRY